MCQNANNTVDLVSSLIPYVFGSQVNGESESLYNRACDILADIPQHIDNKILNDEIPMDYSFRYQELKYKIDIRSLSPELQEVKTLLEQSSELGNVDATYLLADMNLYGNYSYPKNGSQALKYYEKVTELQPNSTAYYTLGFLHATGLFGEIEQNQGKANMYYQFAFELGDLKAGMVLGYRHLNGISMPMDCNSALFYYRYIANKLLDYFKSGPIGGPAIDSFAIRIADFQGGIYGKNVGEASSSLNRKASRYDDLLAGSSIAAQESYYASAYFKILNHYEGSYVVPRNYERAMKLAKIVMDRGMTELGALNKLERIYLARAVQKIGKMYLRGESVEQNFETALEYLTKSIEINPTPLAKNDLGLLYEFGPPNFQNITKATEYYRSSASSSLANAKFNYGRMLLNQQNPKGFDHIKSAAFSGDREAIFHYAKMTEDSEAANSCDMTARTYRTFAEAIEPFVSNLEWAFHELISGRPENALIGYAMAAEQGYETAQASAAYILYQPPSLTEDPPLIPKKRKEAALVYLTRSSRDYDVDSTVLMGDIYFSDGEHRKAVACYEAAASRQSSHASWNLGWMYENGYGVEQDFHLAKRHYDLSLLDHPKAYIPVQIALMKLRIRSFINHITGGSINSIEGDKEKRTWSDWKDLYTKIRNGNYNIFEGDTEESDSREPTHNNNNNAPNEERVEDPDEVIEGEDFAVLLFFLIVFLVFFGLHLYQQRQMRRRGENGDPQNRPNVEFNFRVIAI